MRRDVDNKAVAGMVGQREAARDAYRDSRRFRTDVALHYPPPLYETSPYLAYNYSIFRSSSDRNPAFEFPASKDSLNPLIPSKPKSQSLYQYACKRVSKVVEAALRWLLS
jgi:hypothetical protein